MSKFSKLIFVGLPTVFLSYLITDKAYEYQYWKKMQKDSRNFVNNVIADTKRLNKTEIEEELNHLKSDLDVGKSFSSKHEKVEKIAKMFILNDVPNPQNQNYSDLQNLKNRYIQLGEGLAPDCHFDFLILLYQKEAGLSSGSSLMRNDPAFNNFCQGWNELDRDFGILDCPHGRSELRY